MSIHVKQVFKIMGLPNAVSFDETGIKPSALKRIQASIEKAPQVGTVIISGVSSPVLQQLFENGRKVAAVDYLEFFNAKFTEEQYNQPPTRAGQVTLIYNIGREPVKDFLYSSKLLQTLITKYNTSGLAVLETHLTPSTFNMQYQMDVKNKFIIPPVEEEVWTL